MYYPSLILILWTAYLLSIDSLLVNFVRNNIKVSHHLCIYKSWLTNNNPHIICRYIYDLSLYQTLHFQFSWFVNYCHETKKPNKKLFYILQNIALTEVAYFIKVNYLASNQDLNVGGTSIASTSQIHMYTLKLLQIIGN